MARHVCPIWVGYLLTNPLRKILNNPDTLLRPYVTEGMTALDVGCAMGFFSLPLARLVGPSGKVICVDVQQRMLRKLENRTEKAGLSSRIETHLCQSDSLCLQDHDGSVDFILAFAVMHEVPFPQKIFAELKGTLRARGRLFVAEPKVHVSKTDFEKTISTVERAGFKVVSRPTVAWNRAVLMEGT